MILTFDIGNTMLKWGAFEDGRLVGGGRARHRPAGLDAALATVEPGAAPRRIAAVNVAGAVARSALEAWARSRFGLEVAWIDATVPVAGMRTRYRDPSALGADRWAAVVGAFRNHGASLVADIGTAATVDAVDADGVHLGGCIVPGLVAMRSLLAGHTEAVRPEGAGAVIDGLGVDTAGGVELGAEWALAALIDSAAAARLDARVIVTGGDADRVIPRLRTPHLVDPELVLRGVAAIAEGAR